MQDAFAALGQAIGLTITTMAIMTVAMVVFMDIWAKYATRGRIYAYFHDKRFVSAKLLKEDAGDACLYLGRGANREKYNLDENKQFWTMWPPGLPRLVQTPVRTHWYAKNNPVPFDPTADKSSISAKTNMMITDEAMLRQTWKDVREVTGTLKSRPMNLMLLILLLVIFAVAGYNLYLTMGIQKVLGG